MRLDKDYLMELELWSHFELRGLAHKSMPPVPTSAPASSPAPTSAVAPARAVANPAVKTSAAAPSVATPQPAAARQAKVDAPMPVDPARLEKISRADWATLAEISANCTVCTLCKQRNQVVFGVGAQSAQWLFIGEGPGAEEDQSGEPFVGQAGKLLDAMLTAVGLQRGREVYIANVVKCRPPGNRTPLAEEAAACAPLLDRQIELIRPKIIVALGRTAITRLTGSEAAMAAVRGRVHTYRNIPVIATYHPAYLLRNLPEKLKAWEDLQLAKRTFSGD
jgi:uracil-DNA glycosylase family 4